LGRKIGWGGKDVISIFDAEDSIERRLLKAIRFNARIIRATEGKSSADAVYWAIRMLLDTLREQRATESCRIVMEIVKTRYPDHLQNVLRYSAWTGSGNERDAVLAPHRKQKQPVSNGAAAATLASAVIKVKKTI
jgi:hypothetical protein